MPRICVFLAAVILLIPAVAAAKLELRLGIVTTPGSAQHVTAVKFQELVRTRSGGEIDVVIHHSATLGDETEILQQIQLGAVQLGIITAGPLDAFVPEIKVVSFPFLFKDYAQVDEVLDGPLGRETLKSLEKAGFKGLAFSENGFRHLTNSVHPVRSAAEVAGLKIRVMESKLHKELWRELGANPTPMGWPIYAELEQGAIDGQENPLWVVWLAKLFEVQEHLSLTGHVYSAHVALANLDWFGSLPGATQDLLAQAMTDAAVYQRAWNRDNEAGFLAKLKSAGMKVVDDPETATFRARSGQLQNLKMFTGDAATAALLEKFLAATK